MKFHRLPLALAAAVAVSGCASLNQVSSDVVGYGAWPAGRAPGSYVFERLPSQQAELTLQQQLEDAARPALAQAGFTPAADPAQAGVSVQINLRNMRFERLDYSWGPWGGPWGPWGPGWAVPGRRYPGYWGNPWGPPWWGPSFSTPWYEREVSVLIRERNGGAVLYEGHARSDGALSGGAALYEAMFRAALADFPQGNPSPRRVNVPLGTEAAKAQ